MKHRKSLLPAGVFTVLGLGILMWLGFWQLDRLEWKTALLAKIEANMAMAPIPLEELAELEENEFRRVCASGEFLHEKELFLFSINLTGAGGYQVYTPLITAGGKAVIVNRGWVPNPRKDPATRLEGQLPGVLKVCGVLRLESKKRRFAPENDPAKGAWFYRDGGAMGRAAGLEGPVLAFIDADETANPGGYPIGGQTRVNIPNNHLGYAITWFGLALALTGVFAAFVISQRKK